MKRKLIIIGLLILSIASLLTTVVHSDQEPIEALKAEVVVEEILTPTQYADKYATQYGIDASVFKKVMFCESSNNPKAIGDGGRAKNVMQFHKPTFDAYAKKYGEELDYNSYHDQIELAAWMFSKGEQGHWTCYKIVTGK